MELYIKKLNQILVQMVHYTVVGRQKQELKISTQIVMVMESEKQEAIAKLMALPHLLVVQMTHYLVNRYYFQALINIEQLLEIK